MDVQLAGTGGPAGWPQPGCRCASCSRARLAGLARAPTEIVIDGLMRIAGPPWPAAPAGYLAEPLVGGLEVTAPDGGRLLCAAGPGAVPLPPEGAAPYDAALLDLLGEPAQLGGLRKRGLVTGTTAVAMIHVDHRVSSPQELARRCRLWRVRVTDDGDHLAASIPAMRPGEQVSRPWRVLLLGGACSGKSGEAELRLAAEPDVTYVAAAGPPPRGDAEWSARVAAHRARRPSWWRTVETTDLPGVLGGTDGRTGAVLIDSIGSWLTAVLDECGAWRLPPAGSLPGRSLATGPLPGRSLATGPMPGGPPPCQPLPGSALAGDFLVAGRLADRIDELVAAWRDTRGHVIAVSEEAGSGVVPDTRSGRIFRDELGRLNQLLAGQSEEALLVVAGRLLSLPG